MQNRNVLISGAGIAGTALAHWLRHHGFRPTVVERASALREGGYKIDMRRFAEENQKLGPSNIKHMVMRTKRQISIQLTVLSLLGRLPGKQRMMAKVMEPIQKAANSITLKDY
ncbi:hypothetical protein ACE1OC_21135 [Streptomyces sp. DSM 116496]|uniref:hypothetical protein n=1 Tax=Streptomyces stoeckheimensis TaxID=3344656 RepID=UPI0038B33281